MKLLLITALSLALAALFWAWIVGLRMLFAWLWWLMYKARMQDKNAWLDRMEEYREKIYETSWKSTPTKNADEDGKLTLAQYLEKYGMPPDPDDVFCTGLR